MKIIFRRIEDFILHDMFLNILWGIFTMFCFGVFVWMLVTVIAGYGKTIPAETPAIARHKRVVACVERKYRVRHIFLNTFEEKDGNRFSIGNYGACGENPDQ